MEWLYWVIGGIAILIYCLVGWFLRALWQDDWEEPSILMMFSWPLIGLAILIVYMFTGVEKLAEKIKEKKDDN